MNLYLEIVTSVGATLSFHSSMFQIGQHALPALLPSDRLGDIGQEFHASFESDHELAVDALEGFDVLEEVLNGFFGFSVVGFRSIPSHPENLSAWMST
jgi:hypothetical protein